MALRRIIHISDLHFSEKEGEKSLLQKEKYVQDWIESLSEIEGIDTLIISGDIVNRGGSERAYRSAGEVIERIKKTVGIKHILCVPGNHDVSRDLLNGIKGDADVDSKMLWKYNDKKLKYYWKFVEGYSKNSCDKTGLVSYEILTEPNMILLGIDSTHKIGTSDECGFINIDSLKESLEQLFGKNSNKYKDHIKIAVLHHRPVMYESGSQAITENNSSAIGQYGTCDSENWEKVKKVLLKYDVHYVLTGHVHGSQSGQIRPYDSPNDGINYSTVGSIGVDFSRELKERLNQPEDKQLLENLEELRWHASISGNHNAYNIWTFDDRGLVREEQYKYIIDEGKRRWCLWGHKDFEEELQVPDEENVFDTEVVTEPGRKEEPENYEEKILEAVRDHELYKTGHYHWKNSAKHNWIDTSYFFQHREMMFCIARGINKLFEQHQELRRADCIIGLGIKGSIMLSYVRFLFPDTKCTYLPDNKKEYNNYEMMLFEDRIRSIVVLTDVVHSGNTVKALAKEIYERKRECLKVNIVTIFDTKPGRTIAAIERVARFKLFSLANLMVNDCQGGVDNCDIYVKKLANVIEYKED